jgi:SAM-dependent methyltransferase
MSSVVERDVPRAGFLCGLGRRLVEIARRAAVIEGRCGRPRPTLVRCTKTEIAGGDTAAPISVRKRVAILREHLPDSALRVLDGGCGRGGYVRAIQEDIGVTAIGVEFRAEKIDEAIPEVRSALVRGDLEQLGIRDCQFDGVLLNEVLEHVPSDERALCEAHRVLRPGGTLVVMSPNRIYPFESHGVHLRGLGWRLPIFTPFVPYVPLHVGTRVFTYWARNYWPRELRALVMSAGFTIQSTGFVWQTFEGISGHQPRVLRAVVPAVRWISAALERTPIVRQFGVSQLIVARR